MPGIRLLFVDKSALLWIRLRPARLSARGADVDVPKSGSSTREGDAPLGVQISGCKLCLIFDTDNIRRKYRGGLLGAQNGWRFKERASDGEVLMFQAPLCYLPRRLLGYPVPARSITAKISHPSQEAARLDT